MNVQEPFDLEKLRSKDPFEWQRLGDYVVKVVRRHRLSRGREESFVEDRAQETMVKLWRNIGTAREAKTFPAFVGKTVTNVLKDWYRATRNDPLQNLASGSDTDHEEGNENQNPWESSTDRFDVDPIFEAASVKESFALIQQVASELGEECRSWFQVTERFERGDRKLPDTGAMANELGINVDAYYKRGERCRERLLNDPRIMAMQKK